jgi:hypothetical protein
MPKLTIFQSLDKALTGKWNLDKSNVPHVNSYDVSKGNTILYKTTDKQDYEKTKLELQQDAYLKSRWIKANVDLSVSAFSGLNNVKLMYRDADLMDAFPEIGAALDIVSEESTLGSTGNNGQIVNVYSKSDRIKSILEDLFVNRLNLQVTASMVVRGMCKYGNQFMLLDIDKTHGVKGWRQLPVFNVERLENGIVNPYGTSMNLAVNNGSTDTTDMSTRFVWTDENNSQTPFRNWQIAHFRLLTNQLYLPYGCLVGDTRIETEFGYKEMSNIEIGDKVWTFNIETQQRELGCVTMFMPKGEKDVYKVSTFHNEIEGTEDHKLLTYSDDNLSYKEIKDLKVGDLLIVDNSYNKQEKKYDLHNRLETGFKTEKIRKIEYVGKKQTYDFTVNNDNSNFFANGIVTHNCSYLNSARRHWRMLSLMEDMMLIYRLERSIERRVYKIFVGAIDDADVKAYVEDIANNFKRTPIIDPMTGQIDLRKNILDVSQDLFIPVRDQNAPTPIDTLAPAQNMTALDDIKFVQNKVLTALRIPKSFLNFEEESGDGKNLALMDVRFTRTVNKIQQAFLMELTKVASIHLYLLGFEDDLTNFSLSMNNPSTQAEQLEIENIQKKVSAARDAVSDPGNGLPIMSQTRALKEIMKWSDKDIKDNLEEIRLEKAIAAELEKTSQIIKRTGLFDVVDRMYGEPGAEYQDAQGGSQEGDEMGGGMPGGMGGGMPSGDFGAGLEDLGTPGGDEMGELAGEEGVEPTAEMGGDNEEGGGIPMESTRRRKPLIVESSEKRINRKGNDLTFLLEKYLDKIKTPNDKKNERVGVIDKTMLINEEFNKMINSLDEKLNNDEENVNE